MSYIFGKLWHLAINWAIRIAFQCILQGVRFLLANHTRLSPTFENDSYMSWPHPQLVVKISPLEIVFLFFIFVFSAEEGVKVRAGSD